MTKIKVYAAKYGLKRSFVTTLDEALKPEDPGYARGIAEGAVERAEHLAAVVGRLLALMVEKNVLTLDEAKALVGKGLDEFVVVHEP